MPGKVLISTIPSRSNQLVLASRTLRPLHREVAGQHLKAVAVAMTVAAQLCLVRAQLYRLLSPVSSPLCFGVAVVRSRM